MKYFPIKHDVRLRHPFTCIVNGPTGSGKTHFIHNFLLSVNNNIIPAPTNLLLCYGKEQALYNEILRNAPIAKKKLHIGKLEAEEMVFNKSENNLLIIDDLMDEIEDDVKIGHLFTRGSHHDNVSVIIFTQNLFPKGKVSRTLSINAHYFFLFKNPRDASQIMHLAKQVMPSNSKEIVEAYNLATEKSYAYLFLNFHQETPHYMRMMSNVFNEDVEDHTYVYVTDEQFKSIKKKLKSDNDN